MGGDFMKIILSIMLSCLAFSAFAQDANESSSMTVMSATVTPIVFGGTITTIYDDTIDGDLGDRDAPTTVFLGSGLDRVTANVGGVDFDDCMTFTVPVGNNIFSITLEDYIASGGNTTSGFQLYTGNLPGGGNFGDIFGATVGPANIGQDILTDNAASPLTSGDYSLCLLEGTANQLFSVVFGTDIVAAGPAVPVPVNNFYWLLLLSGFLLFIAYRKKASI